MDGWSVLSTSTVHVTEAKGDLSWERTKNNDESSGSFSEHETRWVIYSQIYTTEAEAGSCRDTHLSAELWQTFLMSVQLNKSLETKISNFFVCCVFMLKLKVDPDKEKLKRRLSIAKISLYSLRDT